MIESVASSLTDVSRFASAQARPVAARETAASRSAKVVAGELSAQDLQVVAELKQTDRQVRAHEQAHLSAGGNLVRGGATFTYTSGPDQQRYAVGGEVSIDVAPGRTPQETIDRAERIRAAALAPADPSTQDLSVAAYASSMESAARAELASLERQQAPARASESSSDDAAAVFYRSVASSGAEPGAIFDSFA